MTRLRSNTTAGISEGMSYHCTYDSNPCHEGPLGPSLEDACSGSTFLVFMSLLNTLIRNHRRISGHCERVVPVEATDYFYDFIVVGGGAAGAVVASRLSENSDWKVLLLEAGPDEPAGAEVPGFATKLLKTEIIWDYKTTNESHACLATNGSCSWPSGKNLGGNTVHSAMIYMRGHPADYDHWAELGNVGWSWSEVKPYFLKSENNVEIERVGTEHHATGGPVSVERFPHIPPFGHAILNASEELGHGVSEDLNGDTKTGFSIAQATHNKGVRQSSAAAYLRPARNRWNLHISLNSTVTRVIIENGTAVGVEYSKNGQQHSVHVTKEVILSGSVVESPHLLMLSGIGPREHLESVGVTVVKDLPGVGENLHDHPCTPLNFEIEDDDTYDNNWEVAKEYLAYQTGPLSSSGSLQIIGMLESNFTTPNRPDVKVYVLSHLSHCAPGGTGALQSSGKRRVTMFPTTLYPESRGRITLKSKNPLEQPLIWNNYLGESEDMDRMVAAIKMVMALTETEALRRYNLTLVDSPLEACADHEFKSDQYWACVARQRNWAVYHQGGTCKMGPSSDPMAVVDPRLRVYGIRGLRVADISIMPKIPASNTVAPVMMIGEHAADMIKEDWTHSRTEGQ